MTLSVWQAAIDPVGMRGRHRNPRLGLVWRELGTLGRIAFLGVGVSGVVAVGLGFLIPASVSDHIVAARLGELERAVVEIGVSDADFTTPAGLDDFGHRVGLTLIGGDIVRVKVWDSSGAILWSDEPRLVGAVFDPGDGLRSALDGYAVVERTRPGEPENRFDADLGRLIEFYVPVVGPDGAVETVFEVYQRSDPLDRTLAEVRAATWLRIGTGLALLAVFTSALSLITVRGVDRRRRESEMLLDQSLRLREEERTRLVVALHDDIGQPLYRLLYGIEALGSARLSPEQAAQEAERLAGLVGQVDDTLRNEMRRLRSESMEQLGLGDALRHLTSERVSVSLELAVVPEPDVGEAVYRAVREAIANAERHSGAQRISVTVSSHNGEIVAEVVDDGTWRVGPPGLGLATVRRLLESVDGELEVGPAGRRGTRVVARAPLGRAT